MTSFLSKRTTYRKKSENFQTSFWDQLDTYIVQHCTYKRWIIHQGPQPKSFKRATGALRVLGNIPSRKTLAWNVNRSICKSFFSSSVRFKIWTSSTNQCPSLKVNQKIGALRFIETQGKTQSFRNAACNRLWNY